MSFSMKTVPARRIAMRNKRQKQIMRRQAAFRASIPRGLKFRLRVHNFKQTFYPATGSVTVSGMTYPSAGNLVGPTSGGGTDGAFTIYFQAADLPQVSSFSALFDEYKVNKVVYKFVPEVQQVTWSTTLTDTATPFQLQYLNTVIDYDDATALTSMNQAMEYESFRSTPQGKITKRIFVPSISNEVYRTGGGTIGYGRKSKQWVDMAYTDIPHYGVKGYIDHYAAAQASQRWKVFCTVYMSFRQVR